MHVVPREQSTAEGFICNYLLVLNWQCHSAIANIFFIDETPTEVKHADVKNPQALGCSRLTTCVRPIRDCI
jgi:hypothetical protein